MPHNKVFYSCSWNNLVAAADSPITTIAGAVVSSQRVKVTLPGPASSLKHFVLSNWLGI